MVIHRSGHLGHHGLGLLDLHEGNPGRLLLGQVLAHHGYGTLLDRRGDEAMAIDLCARYGKKATAGADRTGIVGQLLDRHLQRAHGLRKGDVLQ